MSKENEPSPAEVSSEELTRIYNESNGIDGKNPPITTERIFKAMRACLALNQRLAVKEGEGLECIGTLSECPVSGMFVYLNDNIERQYEGAAVYVVRSIEKDAQ